MGRASEKRIGPAAPWSEAGFAPESAGQVVSRQPSYPPIHAITAPAPSLASAHLHPHADESARFAQVTG